MITFESEYKNFSQRLFTSKNLVYFISFIFYSYLIFISKILNFYTITIELALFTFYAFTIINESKSNIDTVTFKENSIILHGETFNTKWIKSINIKKTYIQIQSIGSRQGLRSATFYLMLKNKKDNYVINSIDTYSDEGIIQIFNEFKKFKEEKIIVDERLILLRIQEKIEKCQ
ncbi:hypothetical protein [Flavobacterium sp. MDT1-60]|uniref:hypothetical protein n=1 Tax=Flavobacterium sp. MDT1-60 TaxID=1979344 RepID=UPI0017816D9D|nr:hypothetical protein [Flavobacterium sp. MDT1-60]QOG01475.1 hypothetical protein IHE43_16900 [Flavobacterium sp. MDT1-60]